MLTPIAPNRPAQSKLAMFLRPRYLAVPLALCAALGFTGVAAAQDAPLSLQPGLSPQPKPAPKRVVKRARPVSLAGKLVIHNDNPSTLLSLTLSTGGDLGTEPVAQDVQPGATVTVALPKSRGCVYSVHASFEDWSSVDVEGDDLCRDPTITLEPASG